jgi:hypothetical protein
VQNRDRLSFRQSLDWHWGNFLTETFAMTSTGMAFEGALVGTGTDKKEGDASVGPTMIEDGGRASNDTVHSEERVCLTFAGEGVSEP